MLPSDQLQKLGPASTVIAALIMSGVTYICVSSSVQCADGSTQLAKLEFEFSVDADGEFDGMRNRISPIG